MNWQKIWGSRNLKISSQDPLTDLIRNNGFDTGVGDYSTTQWMILAKNLCSELNINSGSRVFEVGCGCGALLMAIQELKGCMIGGVDYSPSLISTAKNYLPSGSFQHGEANNFILAPNSQSAIISHSVFQYFPDHNYSREVIYLMAEALRSDGMIAIMDINDITKESIYHTERRSSYRDPKKYDEDYKELKHLFFSKHEIEKYLLDAGFVNISIFPHAVSDYRNSAFRFNVKAKKK